MSDFDLEKDQLDDLLEEMDLDDEFSLMSSSSEEILVKMIREQIQNRKLTLGSLPNLFEIIKQRFNFLNLTSENNPELLNRIKIRRKEIFSMFLKEIANAFDLILDTDQYEIDMDLEKILSNVYEFFIIENKKVYELLVQSYINSNREEIIKSYKVDLNKKDLEFINLKKKTSLDNLVIINSMENIVKDSLDFYRNSPEEIFKNIYKLESDNICFSNIYKFFFDDNEPMTLINLGDHFSVNFFSILNEEENISLLVNNLNNNYLTNIYNSMSK
jgi:hypothetical protein